MEEDNSNEMDLTIAPSLPKFSTVIASADGVGVEGDNAQYNDISPFENDDNESGGAHPATIGENAAAVNSTTHNDNSESCAVVGGNGGDENENEDDDAVVVDDDVAEFTTVGDHNDHNNNNDCNTLLSNPTFESPVHPIAISQVDRIIKQSLTDLASVSLAIANAKASAKKKSSSSASSAGGLPTETSADHTFNISKDAKLAIHKSANVFVLMLAAMVEHNRKEALVSASEAHQRAVKQGGPRSRAAQQAASALAAAEKKYKGIISGKEIEAALESAGYKHLVPMMAKRPRDDN